MAAAQPTIQTGNGGRLVASDGRELPLRSVHLSATAGGGIARVVLTQRYVNPHDEALEVRYLLPLPSDGAVSGFAFTLGDTRVVGEVTGKQQARRRFEQALVRGNTAALLEQDRSSLFTQRVGNIPPRSEITAEVTVDQPLRWLADGQWEWRFPTVVAPRYQGAPGRVVDAAKLNVPVAAGGVGASASLSLSIVDRLTGSVASTSHPVVEDGEEPVHVSLGGEGQVRLDRDIVVRWPVALPEVSANVIAARPATAAHDGDVFALLTVAPPTTGGVAVPRDLTFLIDTSGSMGGRPLAQAAEVVAQMIATLGVNDRIELIEFGDRPRRWKGEPVRATASAKEEAIAWVRGLHARGATEMHRAVIEALRPLRADAQRQVVLVTDGYIGFEREILQTLLTRLPAGARLHTVGVGDSVNRSLTEAAARAGRGTELIVGINEDPRRVVGRLLARTTAPLVTDLTLEGSGLIEVAPGQLPDLYAEAPTMIAVRLSSRGGDLLLRGRTAGGSFERRFRVEPLMPGQGLVGIAALFGREKVEDLEMSLTAGANPTETNATIEATGVEFQIATRLTSWVAVSEQVTVQVPGARRTVEQPHELPHGVSAEGLGLRAPGAPADPFAVAKQNFQIPGAASRSADRLEQLQRRLLDAEDPFAVDEDALLGGADPFGGFGAAAPSAPGAPPAGGSAFGAPPPPRSSRPPARAGRSLLPPEPPQPPEELEIEFDDSRGGDDLGSDFYRAARLDSLDDLSADAPYDPIEAADVFDALEESRDASREDIVLGDDDLRLTRGPAPDSLTRTGASLGFDVDAYESAEGSGVRRLRSSGRVARSTAGDHDPFSAPAAGEAKSKVPLVVLLLVVALLALVLLILAGAFKPKPGSSDREGRKTSQQDGGSRPGVGGRR